MGTIGTRRLVVVALAAVLGLATAGTSSCGTSTKDLNKAQHDLNKATKGLNAIDATCKQLRNNPQAAHDFDQSVAEDANRTDEPVGKTVKRAQRSRERHCAESQNPNYKPYSDVSIDVSQ